VQNFSDLVQGTLSNSGLIGWEGLNNVHFPMENWPCFGNGERYGQGYYKSLIVSGIHSPFRWNENHRCWM